MRLRRCKLILGAIALLATFGLAVFGAGFLIGQAVGREMSRQLSNAFGETVAKALWK